MTTKNQRGPIETAGRSLTFGYGGSAVVSITAGAATSAITLPTGTRTLATLDGTEALSGKTLTGNAALYFTNGGVTITLPTLTGTLATLAGAENLTGKTYNGLNLSTTTGTFTLTNAKTLAVTNSLTLGSDEGSSVAFGAGGTVAYTGGTLAQFAATTSLQLKTLISDETGSGPLVFATDPALAGTPTSTTAAVDTNTTQIATTAYVIGQAYAKLASPTFTGTVTLPILVGSDTTDSSSSTTGAFKTAGGMGVAKKLFVGTSLTAGTNTTTVTHTFHGANLTLNSVAAGGAAAGLYLGFGGSTKAIYGVAGTTNDFITGAAANDMTILTSTSANILFSANNGTTLHGKCSSAGAWTFGPSGSLVHAFNGANLQVNRSASGSVGFTMQIAGTNERLMYWDDSLSRFYITDGDGSDGVYLAENATSWTANSDSRLKENVVQITGAMTKLSAIRGVSYNWIHSGESAVGVIAQEVLAVYPEAVDIVDETKLGVRYTDLIPLLIEAAKEQQALIIALEARLAALESV